MRFRPAARMLTLAIPFVAIVWASGLMAQNANVTIVNAPLKDAPPTGPNRVVVEQDQGLATHTIYRPADLGSSTHGLVVWGEGGCAKNGLTFPEYLAEIASYGYVVLADGPPVMRADGAKGKGGPPKGAPKGKAAAPKGKAGAGKGLPTDNGNMTDGSALIAAIDWMENEVADPSSRFYQKVDTSNVAAMGMSCGGLMSYGASADPRIGTVGIWNSGLFNKDEKILNGIHSPVILITGGESDIAYENGKSDFEVMPARVPIFYGVYPSVGHGGTYTQDNGGPFGKVAVAWLKWQLSDDTSRSGKGYFVGDNCVLCADAEWQVDSRSLR